MTRRGVAIWFVVVLLVSALVFLLPRAESGDATLALRRFLASTGVTVRAGPAPPDDGAFVLLSDLRGPTDAMALLDWVDGGGRLVVADPASGVVALLGTGVEEPLGLAGEVTIRPGCAAGEGLGVESIAARASDWALEATPEFVACFPAGDGAYLLVRHRGAGTIVLLGGHSALTNEFLRQRDNAVLAKRLLGGERVAVFGPAVPPSPGVESAGLWESLPAKAKVVVVALSLGAIVFALVRGRRLGRPIDEAPLVPIPAGELARSVGHLYRRAQEPGYAGRLMREATVQRLGPRFGEARDSGELTAAVAASIGVPIDRVHEALAGAEPTTDEKLIRLGSTLAEIEDRVRGRT